MHPEDPLFFAPFRLDRASEQLWCGEERLALRPKTFALLRYLAEHPERLVSQAELLRVVWGRSYASEGLLRAYIRELREALGDDAKAPRFIETAIRRGYRFIAPVTRGPPMPALNLRTPPADASPFVGREAELARLQTAFEQAVGGQRQFVFVTGEPGLGKTALMDAFLVRITGVDSPWITSGQCVESYGAAEACLPLLEAVGRLARGTRGREIVPILRRLAPAWLLHMPALIEEAELAELQRSAYGATHERMVRELAEALEALSRVHPLVLCLEDLHWSDNSTVDLLAMLARRREPAHLLVVGSYRPGEASASMHPVRTLARGLLANRHCGELALPGLTVPEVGQYLSARFGLERYAPAVEAWARVIHDQSDGNALFMVAMVTDLVIRDAAGAWSLPARPEAAGGALPESLRQFLEGQLERLGTEDRRVLETASVAGMGFSAALLAAVMETDVDQVEECCETLIRRQLLLRAGDGRGRPERRGSERYVFLHAVYRRVLYERLTAARRIRLHRRTGEARERAYGDRARDIAAELAMHFEQGQDSGGPYSTCNTRPRTRCAARQTRKRLAY